MLALVRHTLTARMQKILHQNNPTMLYSWRLVERCMKQARVHSVEEGSTGMTLFFERSMQQKAYGTLFDCCFDVSQRLHSCVRQTPLQRAYMVLYGQYLAVDGTHLVDKYGHTAILPTVIDCLGRLQNAGCVLAPSEDGDTIEQGCLRLSAAWQPEEEDAQGPPQMATLHTDEAPWGESLAKALGRRWQLCSIHYGSKVCPSATPCTMHCTLHRTMHGTVYCTVQCTMYGNLP
jgi:hypothetical protein